MSRLLVAVPAALVVVALLWLGLLRGPNLDAAVFLTIAEQMRAGAVPYRDLFDHKPPGIYLAEYAVGSLVPFIDSWSRAWAMTLVAALATLGLLAWRLAPVSRVATAIALVAVSPMLASFGYAQSGGYTESLAILPATASLLVATRARPSAINGFAAGVLMALALGSSFQLAPAAVGALVALLASRGFGRPIAAYVAGGGLVAAIVVAWLAWSGALGPALEQLIAYNRAYGEGQSLFEPITLATIAALLVMAAPAVAAGVLRIAEIARRRTASSIELGCAVWVIGSAAFVIYQGRFFGHYLVPLAAPLAILSVPVLARLSDGVRPNRRFAGALVGALAIGFPLYFVARFEPGTAHREPTWSAARLVAERTAAGDRIFVWGNDAAVYLYADRAPAGPYAYLWPLTQATYPSDAMIAALLRQWLDDPPAAIVDASDHPTGPSSARLVAGPGEGPVSARLAPLRSFVQERYVPAGRVDSWEIYVLD